MPILNAELLDAERGAVARLDWVELGLEDGQSFTDGDNVTIQDEQVTIQGETVTW